MKDMENLLYDSSRRCILIAVDVLEQKPELFADMLSLCLEGKYPMAMRAARAIQFYCEAHPETLYPYLDYVLPKFLNTKVDGVKRSFLKLLRDNLDLNKIPDLGLVLSKCYDWLLSDKEAIAVRVYSFDVIYKIALMEPDLFQELIIVVDQLDLDTYPSLRCRVRQIKKEFKKRSFNFSDS